MDVKLLRKMVKFAEDEPRRFNMGTWYADAAPVLQGNDELDYFAADASLEDSLTSERQLPPCGTIACLAGTAAILSGAAQCINTFELDGVVIKEYDDPKEGWFEAGRKALGLTKPQAQRLFYPSAKFVEGMGSDVQHWPEPYASDYEAVKDQPAKRVAVMRRRVNRFIESKGRV